jgi:hypothetical protein
VVYSGYLIDIYCYRLQEQGGLSLDGSDIIRAPWDHTVHCLRDVPVCRTYYLAENRATDGTSDYHMKLILDDTSNRNALALVSSTRKIDDFKVTARGMHDGRGNLINASFEECSGNRCDGVCTGSCAIDTPSVTNSTSSTIATEVQLGQHMTAEYSTSQNGAHVNFTVKLNSDGWLAFGVSSDGTMTSGGNGSDVFVCSGGEVKRYWITSFRPSGGVAVPGSECAHGPVSMMKFSRTVLSQNGRERSINLSPGISSHLVWAHGSSRTMGYHGGSRGSVVVELGNRASTTVMPTSTLVAPSRKPDAGYVELGAHMSMEYSHDVTGITFTVRFQGDGWIGIGVSPDGTMTGSGAGSDVIACSGGQVKRYWVTSVQLSGGIDVPGSECTHGGTTTMKFTRAALAGSGSQKDISTVPGTLTKFIWAHGSTRSIAYHGTSRGTVSVDVGAHGSGVSASIAPPATLWIHAACMLVAWGALIPFGVAWARLERQNTNQFQSKPVWFAYHRIFQSVGCVLQLAGFACAVAFVQKGGHSHFSTLHTVLGLVVVLLGALQPLNAVFRPHPHKDNSHKNLFNARTLWEYMHKGTGYFAVVLGIVNVVIGILATKNRNYGNAIVPIIAIAIGFFGVCLLVYVMFKLIRHHVSPSNIPDQTLQEGDSQKQVSPTDP